MRPVVGFINSSILTALRQLIFFVTEYFLNIIMKNYQLLSVTQPSNGVSL